MKRERYFLVIDAGTGSVRAVLFDTKGKEIAISQSEWSHKSDSKYPNSMDFDYQKNWILTKNCIKDVIFKADIESKDILAITSCSMREGIVLYDKNQNELWAVANVDSRASKEVEELKQSYPDLEREFYNVSGQTFALGAIPRLLWVKRNRPDIYDKIDKISMISDWVLAKLSNVIASEPSNSGTTGIYSLKRRDWESSFASRVGLRDDIFPKTFESSEVIGEVTKKAQEETGLREGTLVVIGGGDVQLGSAGLSVVKPKDVAILGGSFWQQLVNIEGSITDNSMDIRVNPHIIKGLSQAEGITFFSGLIMRWFRDALCQSEVELAKRRGVDAYKILEELASKSPVGSRGILPIFSDKMRYGKWYHASASLLNLNIDPLTCSKGDIFRALQENSAIVSAENLDAISKFTDIEFDSITFAGGASKGRLWSQILADVTRKVIKVPVVKEASSLGGAFVCGVGAGIYGSIEEVSKELVKIESEFEPNLENSKIYDSVRERWRRAYELQLKLVDEGVTESMWRAPGV